MLSITDVEEILDRLAQNECLFCRMYSNKKRILYAKTGENEEITPIAIVECGIDSLRVELEHLDTSLHLSELEGTALTKNYIYLSEI